MFDETILDSSPLRALVVTRRHYIIAVITGTAGFLVTLKLFPLLLASTRVPILVAPSLVAVTLMFYILMLCYVHADARRLGLRAWAWTSLVVLINLFGFVLYLAYSAARTQDVEASDYASGLHFGDGPDRRAPFDSVDLHCGLAASDFERNDSGPITASGSAYREENSDPAYCASGPFGGSGESPEDYHGDSR